MRFSEKISSALLEMQEEKFGLSNGLEFQASANETVSGASPKNESLLLSYERWSLNAAYAAN